MTMGPLSLAGLGSSSETPTLEMDTGISSEYKFDASDVMICTKELKANL